MSYFLPSYFQKRLLRYALSRLDFIETDELDLENLGITWGQRSIIELKDVGIQVSRLSALLKLPKTICFRKARIQLLRLTVPADLYSSGIVTEIAGVDIEVQIKDGPESDDTTAANIRPTSSVSRGKKSDRPRMESPLVHDPGGTGQVNNKKDASVDSKIPTSEDLAVSFLESEPIQERKELEAVVQSQSQVLQASITSSGSDETGLGAPGGISLPTFIAEFFKGVGDRLVLEVRDVNLTVEVALADDGSPSACQTKMMFKVASIKSHGGDVLTKSNPSHDRRRQVLIREIEVILLCEPRLFSRTMPNSSTSSPRLTRASSNLKTSTPQLKTGQPRQSLAIADEDDERFPQLADSATRTHQDHIHSGSSAELSAADLSTLGFTDAEDQAYSSNKHEMIASPLGSLSNIVSSQDLAHQNVDNQMNAEMLARTGQLGSSVLDENTGSESRFRDLSESQIFTHDEAESMYLSAVSQDFATNRSPAQAMPGAWDSEEASFDDAKTTVSELVNAGEVQAGSQTKALPHPLDEAKTDRTEREHETPPPLSLTESLIAKRLLVVDVISILLPLPGLVDDISAAMSDGLPMAKHVLPSQHERVPSIESRFQSQDFDFQNLGGRQGRVAQVSLEKGVFVTMGTMTLWLDLPIGNVLSKMFQESSPILSAPKKSAETSTQAPSSAGMNLKITNCSLNLCEIVPQRQLAQSSPSLAARDEDYLLRLSLSNTYFTSSQRNGESKQQLSVSKLQLSNTAGALLSFNNASKMRSSMSGSTTPLREDLSLTVETAGQSSKVDVQTRVLHVKLDLLQLDDVLTRSGGLSALLELSNSIVSTSTIRVGSQKLSSPARRRSVRFQQTEPELRKDSDATLTPGKVNIRIGGLVVDIVGSESSMQLRSSAIKTIYRPDLFGLQIDWADLDGPVVHDRSSKPGVKVLIKNVRLEYVPTPRESDLERLLSILAPSNSRLEDAEDEDIMVDTLLRQRRKGGVLRLTLESLNAHANTLQWQPRLVKLGGEISKLSSITKYLPEDDRPGVLTLVLVKKVEASLVVGSDTGSIDLKADLAEAAHVSIPSLVAAHLSTFQCLLNKEESVVHQSTTSSEEQSAMSPPMIMCRFIADEMEPTVKLTLYNVGVNYKVATLTTLSGMASILSTASSEAEAQPASPTSSATSTASVLSKRSSNGIKVSVNFRDCMILLVPAGLPARGVFLLMDVTFIHGSSSARLSTESLEIKKASFMVSDHSSESGDVAGNADAKMFFDESLQTQQLVQAGFVPVAFISAASILVKLISQTSGGPQKTEIDLKNMLLVLETCADSTQTLGQVLGGLSPPSPPSSTTKYRTEIIPIDDMLASFTGNAYFTEPSPEAGPDSLVGPASRDSPEPADDRDEDEDDGFMDDLYGSEAEPGPEHMEESYYESELAQSNSSTVPSVATAEMSKSVASEAHESVVAHSLLDFRSDHFTGKSSIGGTAHRWDSKQNTYHLADDKALQDSPLKVRVRDTHLIWHLFDGYDWQSTRDRITKAVQDIETRASARRPRSTSGLSPQLEEDTDMIGDFLFNSIYIGIPANKDPKELTSAINRNIDDVVSETGSYATTSTATASPTRRQPGLGGRKKRLRLDRSKHHKISFELKGLSADFVSFAPGSGEVESSIDIRAKDFEIIDQVPTSTWKKFLTYMQDFGEREVETNMVHIELLNVKPVAELSASEMVLKVTVLPLRLHVDQDALDFMTRFFEFKDESAPPPASAPNPPFLQRVEVNPIPLKLDFKPKRVNYAGLRSGRTTEFMNFFVLDRADLVLRRVILYGVSGFDKLGLMLNSIWSPDVRRNQLPGVLAGLAPVRSLVDVGMGVRDLIVVPMREYKKDGRIVRSIQKGALAFARTTTKELVNLGAKLAIGTQTVLQNAETLLSPEAEQRWEDTDTGEEKRQISLYADQPLGIVQGLRGAYASLERDLLLARDAIIAVPGEVMASENAADAAAAVLKQAPTIILRPAIGASKAVGQTLLGAGNTMDKDNWRRMQEKYKRH